MYMYGTVQVQREDGSGVSVRVCVWGGGGRGKRSDRAKNGRVGWVKGGQNTEKDERNDEEKDGRKKVSFTFFFQTNKQTNKHTTKYM